MFNLIKQVREVFFDIDESIQSFREYTKLSCINNCGQCCHQEVPNVFVIEMLPLAESLMNSHLRFKTLDGNNNITADTASDITLESHLKTAKETPQGTCAFFRLHDNKTQTNPRLIEGHCAVYSERPSICRLFGFSSLKNGKEAFEPGLCSLVKEERPSLLELLMDDEKAMALIPDVNSFSKRLALILHLSDHADLKRYVPINEAFSIATDFLQTRDHFAVHTQGHTHESDSKFAD